MDVDPDLKARAQRSRTRERASYIAALDPGYQCARRSDCRRLAHENASAKAKLGKIYRLLADADKLMKTFIACSEDVFLLQDERQHHVGPKPSDLRLIGPAYGARCRSHQDRKLGLQAFHARSYATTPAPCMTHAPMLVERLLL